MNYWKMSTFALVIVLGGVLGIGATLRSADGTEKQPHMRSALVNLRSAKAQLEKAEDKGGHCAKAVALTEQAIDEVQKGIDLDAQ
jgi:hypothetical protein